MEEQERLFWQRLPEAEGLELPHPEVEPPPATPALTSDPPSASPAPASESSGEVSPFCSALQGHCFIPWLKKILACIWTASPPCLGKAFSKGEKGTSCQSFPLARAGLLPGRCSDRISASCLGQAFLLSNYLMSGRGN